MPDVAHIITRGRARRPECAPAPRVKLFVRRVRSGSSKRCAVRAAVGGADRSLVRRVRFVAGRARARDRRRPFRRTLVTRARTVSAFARLRNGRALRLKARAARCRSLNADATGT